MPSYQRFDLLEKIIEISILEMNKNAFVRGNPHFLFAGKKIKIPATFISGNKDWGIYQNYNAIKLMKKHYINFFDSQFTKNAGHWVQQENPLETLKKVQVFLDITS